MLLNKIRENLDFRQFYEYDLNLFFKNKPFQLKKLFNNKVFPKIEYERFVIKLADRKLKLK